MFGPMWPGRFALFAMAAVTAAGCTDRPADAQAAGQWRGELASYVVNRIDSSEIEHRLRADDGSIRPLRFAGPITQAPGSRLTVWGRDDGAAIAVDRFEVDADPEPVVTWTAPLLDGPKKPTRRWAFVLLDVDGGGNDINKTNAQSVLFNPDRPDSIRSYFREVSFGLQDLEGEVFGPFPYQMGGRCDTDRLAAAMTQMIPGKFDQYLWFFGKQQAACNFAGVAELGQAARPARHSWFNSFHSCAILVQEPGHNFGMVHSSAMRCTRGGQPVPLAWPEDATADCMHVEYGNPFDPMGGGDCNHMNGVQKAYQDWLGGCNVIKATSSGTFTIRPLASACDGPQLLHIPFPAPRRLAANVTLSGYYLELRAPIGYRDRGLQPQVLVIVANDVREARQAGNNNWLLDMNPQTATPRDSALPVGQKFEDALPGGPKFTVLSADATQAVIQVEIGGQPAAADKLGQAVCSDLKPYDPSATVKCVAPATPAAPPPEAGGADGGAPVPMPMGGAGGSAGGNPGGGTGGAGGGQGGNEPGGAGGSAGGGGSSGGPPQPGGTADAGRGRPSTDPPVTPSQSGSSGGCQLAPGGPAGLLSAGWLAALVLALRRRSRRRPPQPS
jgi:uncharacterized membrane protein YgcG